jgi:hypothetical protein
MSRKPRRQGIVTAAFSVAAVSLLMAPGAQSATLVGSPLTAPVAPGMRACTPSCTDINTVIPEAGANLTAPFTGVIVRWRMIGNAAGGSFELRLVHPEGGGQYTGAGASDPEVPLGVGPTVFPARLTINAGDMIGINVSEGLFWSGNTVNVTGGQYMSVQPTLTDGPPPQMPNFTVNDLESGVNADVEPDADGDGYGDETQDCAPTDPTTHPACPTPPAGQGVTPKKKCKKHKKKHRSAESAKKKKCKKKKR